MPPAPERHATLILSASLAALVLLAWFIVKSRNDSPAARDRGEDEAVTREPGFRDKAKESGIDFRMNFLPGEQGEKFKINLYDHGAGLAVFDFDGDGDDDIYFCNQLGPNALYRNRGDATFEPVPQIPDDAVLASRICVGAAASDYDNDGDQDLFVTTTRGGNVLLRNDGTGGFTDVTQSAGVALVAHSQTATFFDYDRDGYLDLFVANTAEWTTDQFNQAGGYYEGPSGLKQSEMVREHNVMYRNRGDGTFTDVTDEAGLGGPGWGGDVAVFDFDDDGWLDLLVTNMFGASQLYKNQADGTFRDVMRKALVRTSYGAIGAKALDIQNDGRLDLLIADMHSDMWMEPDYDLKQIEAGRKYSTPKGPLLPKELTPEELQEIADGEQLEYKLLVFGNTLFENLGRGRFKEISESAGAETFWPWGVATGDFDNDGFEDIFLPSGMGFPFGYWPNVLLMNDGHGSFKNGARRYGVDPPEGGKFQEQPIGRFRAARSSRCAATGDFDGDGRLEVVVNNFNDAPYFLQNEFPERNWVSFRLTGTHSNRDAIGALVKLYIGSEVLVRQVQPAGGYLSQSTKTVQFGLGDRAAIDRAEVRWPDGQVQNLGALAIGKRHDLREPTAQEPNRQKAGRQGARRQTASEQGP